MKCAYLEVSTGHSGADGVLAGQMSGGGLQRRTVVKEVQEDVQAVDDTDDVGLELRAVDVSDVDAGEQVPGRGVLLEDAATQALTLHCTN